MIDGNVAFIITMFNEFGTVQKTVDAIHNSYQSPKIFIVQSDDGSKKTINNVNSFRILENLLPLMERHKIPAHALSRNYSQLFRTVYDSNETYSFIAALTGDTLLTDPTMAYRIYNRMKDIKKILACSQAISQDFHAATSNPGEGICGGRYQYDGISDFMPQFFMVDGTFANKCRIFSDIEITNSYTTEQCLGDEFMKCIPSGAFKDHALIISQNAHEYSDGVKFNVR